MAIRHFCGEARAVIVYDLAILSIYWSVKVRTKKKRKKKTVNTRGMLKTQAKDVIKKAQAMQGPKIYSYFTMNTLQL